MIRLLAAVGMVLFSAHAAQAEAIVCPESIDVAAQTLARKADGWRYFNDPEPKYQLEEISVFHGKKDLTEMEPSKGTEVSAQWRFSDNGKENYYVICQYKHTSIMLKRQLEPKVNTCTLSFQQDKANPTGPQVMHKMSCE